MSYKTYEQIMNRVQEHYDEAKSLGCEIVGVFLQGSFNYGEGMSDDESDIDTKCLVLPTFEDICLNHKPVSHTHVCANNEHIDIKDVRLYMGCFKKQNVNFVEILFTKYMILNPKYASIIQSLIDNREKIARYDIIAALNCMCGMAMEKLKALEHPYPATMDKIEKYGFDGKQLSHIVRLDEFMNKYIDDVSYAECLISSQSSYLLDLKRNRNITLDRARELAKGYSHRMKVTKDKYLESYVPEEVTKQSVDELFDNVLVQLMKTNLGMEN